MDSVHHYGMTNRFDLKGDVAVVIGGTGSLGGAIAQGLAEAGSQVIILGRNSQNGEAKALSIRENGGKADYVKADAMSAESLKAAHATIRKQFGPPVILVNAAGGNDPKTTLTGDFTFDQIPLEAWRGNFDLNLVGGVFLPCQEFCPAMVESGKGSVINIASVSAHIPLSRVVAYSAAKAAVLSLSQFLAREWAGSGVRVNTITPGFFPAEQNRKILFNEDGTPTERAGSIMGHTPMGRFGNAEELIGAAVFLASHAASSFVTGTDIRVDGGFLSQTI
ncbi:MAG: SDR family oxidoreductase [Verrucomicrobia bacterium]|jgi:NAD(P)-dependent dehydrogenase (short-subunit alcohol dehydrogenase family)|nr:SDR family oxidoreductase [Verrucomicrobiota bacterium]MBT4274154.1 SDR family oxidoreductase [Verrucomicrobiota bacterium]MBT5061114.1 SDR family oxidoreductase [Verrucomicrobiota bacterium]MBT5478216.1 SDR family oxidoreductase [Verrucomicrobiota bacterium]MBT6238493.1 SDR family oxidoreductase [Verrucomicrobiota bacterium]